MSDPLAFPEYTDPVELTPAPAGGMNRSDAWERFAQCRRLQPDALQVLVSADIVDALLADKPQTYVCKTYVKAINGGDDGYRPVCHSCGPMTLRACESNTAARKTAEAFVRHCPHFKPEEAA